MSSWEPDSRCQSLPPEPFAHNFLPAELRHQLAAIWKTCLSSVGAAGVDHPRLIRQLVCAEHALAYLHRAAASDVEDLEACLIGSPRIEVVLDLIGFSLLTLSSQGFEVVAQQAVEAVNNLFRRHRAGVTFAFEDRALLRDDGRAGHNQFVAPALAVLSEPRHALAGSRYRAAFADYDQGHWTDCMGKCCDTLEAVLQAGLAASNMDALAGPLTVDAMRAFVAQRGAPAAFERPFVLLASLRVLLIAARAAGTNRRPISPQQAHSALHSTAAAILVVAAAGQ